MTQESHREEEFRIQVDDMHCEDKACSLLLRHILHLTTISGERGDIRSPR